MKKTPKTTESSDLYRKIDVLELTSADRAEIRHAITIAEKVVDAVIWLARTRRVASTRLSAKPTLKHQ